ncbi:hypothetical protein D910_11479 [Dendroctonus ponderosae]|uniref:Uncharacterized protein n=1 Tax=Dendroctonus ponderosae TaxID=77166 RepID=U4UNX9_DENPD|nr:hypothetical protein D910_11479 [Dendroctonus ponderosae]
MADWFEIIKLLKDVKRRTVDSFTEINQTISRLESQCILLAEQNESLKQEINNNYNADDNNKQRYKDEKIARHLSRSAPNICVVPPTFNRSKQVKSREIRSRSQSSKRSWKRNRSAKKVSIQKGRIVKRPRKLRKSKGSKYWRRNYC